MVAGEPWDWFENLGDHDSTNDEVEILTLPGKPEESGSALTRATGDPWGNGNEGNDRKTNGP